MQLLTEEATYKVNCVNPKETLFQNVEAVNLIIDMAKRGFNHKGDKQYENGWFWCLHFAKLGE